MTGWWVTVPLPWPRTPSAWRLPARSTGQVLRQWRGPRRCAGTPRHHQRPPAVRESWQSTFGGSANSNKIAVLEEGMKYTPIGISPEQAQFLETRKFQVNEIARIFRVPPHMVGDLEKSSFSNIEQQSLEFVKYTLDPWVIRWEQTIHRSLLLPDEKSQYFVKFNLEGLLRGDYQSRMNGYAIGRQNGWMSANDIPGAGEPRPHPCRRWRRPVPNQRQYAPAQGRGGFCKYRIQR